MIHAMADIAAISVIATASTAITVPVVTSILASRRSAADRAEERLAEARKLVDEASECLVRMWWAYSHLVFAWRHGVPHRSSEALDDVRKLRSDQEDANVMTARLATRLGPKHDVVQRYAETVALAHDWRNVAAAYSRGDEITSVEARFAGIRSAYAARRDAYLEAARVLLELNRI
jgi:hypothetical protein